MIPLGQHSEAIIALEECIRLNGKARNDWEAFHLLGICYMYLKQFAKSISKFNEANLVETHESTFLELAKVHCLQDNHVDAMEVYTEALEHCPDSPTLLTSLGLLCLRRQVNVSYSMVPISQRNCEHRMLGRLRST